jgi:hypothetical protein
MALEVEGVEDRCMSGKKSLRRSWTLEALHLALSSPSWLMEFSARLFFIDLARGDFLSRARARRRRKSAARQ